MADIIVDGMTYVAFVPTIANINSPLATEISAGTILHDVLTAAGMEGFDPSPGEVDNTAYSSTFDTKLPGTSSFSGTRLILKKQSGTDTVFTTLTTLGTAGFVAVRHTLPKTTAPATAQKLWDIFPITTGAFAMMPPERNTVLRYWVATPIASAPAFAVTLA